MCNFIIIIYESFLCKWSKPKRGLPLIFHLSLYKQVKVNCAIHGIKISHTISDFSIFFHFIRVHFPLTVFSYLRKHCLYKHYTMTLYFFNKNNFSWIEFFYNPFHSPEQSYFIRSPTQMEYGSRRNNTRMRLVV